MLPVLIYAAEESERHKMLAFLDEYARASGERFQISGSTDRLEDAEFCIQSEEGVLLAILGVSGSAETQRRTVGLERLATEKNRDSYTLYWLADMEKLPLLAASCLHPVGFILPPPDQEHFNDILKRVMDDFASFSTEQADAFLSLQSGGTLYRLSVGRIDYIEALDKKLNIWTQRQCVTVTETLGRIEEMLGERFFRCHRSYLVNYSHIESVDYAAMELSLTSGMRLPLSRSSKDRLKARVSKEGFGHAG